MFTEIFFFELKYRIKRPATWIYFFVFFALSFFVINLSGGAFKNFSGVIGDGGKVHANSPFNINLAIALLNFFGTLVVAAIMGNPVYRDFEYDTHALFYTKPISKFGYLAGRFFGSLVITFLVMSSIGLGLLIGSLMPWLDAEKISPFKLMAYIQPYLVFVIPNIIFTGAIFFTAVTLTRNMLASYVGSVIFLVLYGVAGSLLNDLDNQTIAGLLDPMGYAALGEVTKYWTTFDKNNLLVPLSGILFLNRIIWFAIGFLIWGFSFYKFKFSHLISDKKKSKRAMAVIQEKDDSDTIGIGTGMTENAASKIKITLPVVMQTFSANLFRHQLWNFTKQEFSGIMKSAYFIAIVFAGMVFLFVEGSQVGKMYGTPTYPVTYQMLEFLGGSFSLFMLIIIIFYSGELVWKERTVKINQIIDALPISNALPFLSKLFSLMLVQVVLLFVVMICGIIIQSFKGYYNFEIGLYIKGLFGIDLIDWCLMCVLAMLVQVLVNNKFIGYFVMVIYYIFSLFESEIGIEHKLLQYASDTGIRYSDMNGYGHFLFPYFIFKIYWAAFAVLLAMVSNLLWIRGTETNFKLRLNLAKEKINKPVKFIAFITLIIFLGCGSFIFYNTNILNKYITSKESEEQTANFEKKYKKLEKCPQPKITDVKLNVDIFPYEQNLFIKGTYTIKNKSGKPIDSVFINLPSEAKINKLEFEFSAKRILEDKDNGFYIYRFKKPMMSGDSTTLTMDLAGLKKGFSNTFHIVYNGTFINSGILPSFGYNNGSELSDDDKRKRYGLPEKERMASVHDTIQRNFNCISQDADWINFEATVSTASDQIAIAPGYLQKEWTEGNRKYFHYKMDCKILNFYAFLSARYEVKRDKWTPSTGSWQDVNIEIYYNKGHEYNVDGMIYAIKKSLDYYTTNFSPYQHKQVRILEFPRYASFAQSFPNTIPYSEAIGFITAVDTGKPEDINMPFYVTSHEVAHQWWGHQVIGANVQGATIMMETMAQYSALMVMEHEYGKQTMKKFLKYEMDRYLSGRSFERKKEMPMITMEDQAYIHYNKGSVVMYALKDYIGEDSLNSAMRKYIKATAFEEPPYTTSLEFVDYLRRATPDSLKYIISDMFEKITLFENRVLETSYKKTTDGKYKVTLKVEAKKFVADSLGKETEIPINDWIDIGIFTKTKGKHGEAINKELYFVKRKIDKTNMEFEITVDEIPTETGIDPYNKLIDRHPDDNTKKFINQYRLSV